MDIKDNSTNTELYDEAIRIARKGNSYEAAEYFDRLVKHIHQLCVKTNPAFTMDESIKIVHSNIGYWAGYYENGTIEKVYEVMEVSILSLEEHHLSLVKHSRRVWRLVNA